MDVGWMDIQVRGPSIEVTIEASWLDEPPLGRMLHAAAAMLAFGTESYPLIEISDTWGNIEVVFRGEPENHRLTFTQPEGNTAGFTIERCDDGWEAGQSPYAEIGRGVVDLARFADDLIEDAATLLRTLGWVGYAGLWTQSEFPTASLLRLIALRQDRAPSGAGLPAELHDLIKATSGIPGAADRAERRVLDGFGELHASRNVKRAADLRDDTSATG